MILCISRGCRPFTLVVKVRHRQTTPIMWTRGSSMKLIVRLLLLSVVEATGQSADQECVHGQVRLVQTDLLHTANAGRLEVCFNQQWGTVRVQRSQFWAQKNVMVVCRQLNFTSGLTAIPPEQLTLAGEPEAMPLPGPVHYENVTCNGTERLLISCPSTATSTELTSHANDVHIVCLPGTEAYSGLHTLPVGMATEGDIRLIGSPVDGQGAVEIYSQLGWVSICPDEEWNDADAEVICQRLGYDSGVRQLFTLDTSQISPQRVCDAKCGNSALQLNRITAGPCSFRLSTVCDSVMTYGGVTCKNNQSDVARLFSPSSEGSRVRGIVEVRYNGRWGPVCMPSDTRLAETICAGFGYSRDQSTALVITEDSQRSLESRLKPIWLQGLTCSAFSATALSCTHVGPLGYAPCPLILGVNCYNPPQTPGLSTSAIVAISFGIFVALAFVCWCLVFMFRNCRDSEPPADPNSGSAAPSTSRSNEQVTQFGRRVSVDLFGPHSQEIVRENAELYKAAPPSYRSAAKFPTVQEESPPPYCESDVDPPPFSFTAPSSAEPHPADLETDGDPQPHPPLTESPSNNDPTTPPEPPVLVDSDPRPPPSPVTRTPPPLGVTRTLQYSIESDPSSYTDYLETAV